MNAIMNKGGYQALNYIDGAGDGWIAAVCPQLEGVLDAKLPAYCMVGLPDFFPKVTQRELMVWWRDKVPRQFAKRYGLFSPLQCRRAHSGQYYLAGGFQH